MRDVTFASSFFLWVKNKDMCFWGTGFGEHFLLEEEGSFSSPFSIQSFWKSPASVWPASFLACQEISSGETPMFQNLSPTLAERENFPFERSEGWRRFSHQTFLVKCFPLIFGEVWDWKSGPQPFFLAVPFWDDASMCFHAEKLSSKLSWNWLCVWFSESSKLCKPVLGSSLNLTWLSWIKGLSPRLAFFFRFAIPW